MIPVTRKLIKTLRSVFRAALGLSARAPGPALHVKAGPDGLNFTAATSGTGIRYRLDGAFPDREFWLPFEFLKDAEGNRNDAVLFDPQTDSVDVQWVVDGVPQTRTFPNETPANYAELPEADFAESSPELLRALSAAAQTCDEGSSRYALSCIQLRGETGEIVATDSHQLLIEAGFEFPWEDNVLIPGSRLLSHREFQADGNVGVGLAGEMVVLRAGSWTVWLPIETGSRFPEVDHVVPNIEAATTTVTIPSEDGEFLARSVRQLPADDERHSPVTVDLNGSVAVRAAAADAKAPTELVLSRSSRSGEQVRFCTNRKLLTRAMRLGFDRLHVFSPESPVLCVDGSRKFVWMLLDKEGAIKPSQQATRIESAAVLSKSEPPTPETTRTPPSMSRKTAKRTTARPSEAAQADSSTTLIDRAETLRDSLQTAVTDARSLIAALKQQQKTSRSVQSALKSLRQLEALEV